MQMKSTLKYLRGIKMDEQEKNNEAINQLYRVDFDAMNMDQLKAVSKLVMEARRRQGKARIGALQTGDRVMVTSGRKTNRGRIPKQMNGHVVEIKRTRVVVDCGSHGTWRVPGTMLEKI
jgi:hypothetical protein